MDLAQYTTYVGRSLPVYTVGNSPWRLYRGILEPIAPPHMVGLVDRQEVHSVMQESGALMARWIDGWDTDACDWWYVCCDDPNYDIHMIPSKSRRKVIRRGLSRCEVRTISPEEFAATGHAVYKAAVSRHAGRDHIASQEEFVKGIEKAAELNAWEIWGAFYNGQLAAYVVCLVIEDAVIKSSSKSDPHLLKVNPNDAVSFVLTKHYIRENKARYVSSGARSIYHETNVQNFMLTHGYRQIYCPLRVEFRRDILPIVKSGIGHWGRYLGLNKLLPGKMGKIRAACELARIAKRCQDIVGESSGSN